MIKMEGVILIAASLLIVVVQGTETRCPVPEAPKHGSANIIGGVPKVNSIVIYTCKNGRPLEGVAISKCLSSGDWTNPPPKCLVGSVKPCRVSEIPNGEIGRYADRNEGQGQKDVIFEKHEVGAEVESETELVLRCNEKYQPLGRPIAEVKISCQDGVWSEDPVCKPASCHSEPPQVNNGRIVSIQTQHDGKVIYLCDQNFTETKGDLTCRFGSWTGSPSTCRDSRCYLKDLQHRSFVSSTTPNVTLNGEYLNVKCVDGYSATDQIPNCSNGKWINDTAPLCTEHIKKCRVREMENGFLVEKIRSASFDWRRLAYTNFTRYNKLPVGMLDVNSQEIYLTCDLGYWAQGKRNVTRIPLTCENGRWSPEPECSEEGSECIMPETPKHGFVSLRGGIPRTGSTALYTCAPDFKLVGSAVSRCLSSGEWAFPPPECVGIGECRMPRKPERGDVRLSGVPPKVGNVIMYTCDGLRLIGSTFSECLPSGEWSSPAPECEDVECPELDETEYSVRYRNGRTNGSRAYLTCSNSNVRRTKRRGVLTCLNGTWLGEKPICSKPKIKCQVLPEDEYFVIQYEGERNVNSSVRFSCRNILQKLVGPSVLRCLSNGTWSASPPSKCEDITCPEFRRAEDLHVMYSDDRKVGSRAMFFCLTTLSGESFVTCLPDGSWSGPKARCSNPGCSVDQLIDVLPEDVVPAMENIPGEFVPYGFILNLLCENSNMIAMGTSTVTCRETGHWEVGNIQCKRGCGQLDIAPGSDLIIEPKKNFYRLGDFVSFFCPPGKELSEDLERIMCLQNGWSDNLIPKCF